MRPIVSSIESPTGGLEKLITNVLTAAYNSDNLSFKKIISHSVHL